MEKSSRMQKIVKAVRKRLGLSKNKKSMKSPPPNRRHLIKPVSTPRLLASFQHSPNPKNWREEIDNACDMVEHYRLNKAHQNIGELHRQSRIYRGELKDMKDEIRKLKTERERLARALQTKKPTGLKRPAYGDRSYFIKYEQATKLNVSVPIQTKSSPSLRLSKSPRGLSDCDSAYFSAGSSPDKGQLPKPKLIFEHGKYMSNGKNTYFIAVWVKPVYPVKM